MKRHNASCAVLAAGVAFLVGCGDENNTTEITQVVGMQVVEAGEALPKCTADNEGAMVYSVDSAEAFYCVSRKWVSMKGEKGEDGKKGADGKNGADGKEGAAGADGKDGKDGKDGLKGDKGEQGVKGDSGAAGAAGLSAYEIAKAGGYTGTEEDWIASLKGDPGAKGDSGVAGAAGTSCTATKLEDDAGVEIKCGETVVDTVKNGAKGDSGVAGAAGLSAYDIAKAGGYKGTVEQWIESLKGDPGAAGTSCTAEEVTGGVKITCTDGKTYTLNNGTDGKDGRNFDEGWMVDHRDYHIYKIVTIGTQTWMAENLNYETEMGSYCYKDSAKYCEKYGRLYTWATAVGKSEEECGEGVECNLDTGYVRGVCPKGWHLPDTTEWNALFTAVDGKATAGTMLKFTEGWKNNGNGSDAYFFSALPAGRRSNYGYFNNEGYDAFFWSSTEDDSYGAYNMNLFYDHDTAALDNYYKGYGFSVRCLKD